MSVAASEHEMNVRYRTEAGHPAGEAASRGDDGGRSCHARRLRRHRAAFDGTGTAEAVPADGLKAFFCALFANAAEWARRRWTRREQVRGMRLAKTKPVAWSH